MNRLLIVTLVLGILAIPAVLLYASHINHDSRVASCKQTYQAFPLMFKPFFPPNPKTWTAAQTKNWKRLQDRADELAAGCGKQIKGG